MKNKTVSTETMKKIYDQIKTPYKYGAVVKNDTYMTDSPSVFRYNGKWYMYYIMINRDHKNSGYETHLASSDNLLDWKYERVLLKRTEEDRWDNKQIAGYIAYADTDFGGSNEIKKVNDKYYLSYLGGSLNGYESDPLFMGLSHASSPIGEFEKFPSPIMGPHDSDAREFETVTLYKSNMFIDDEEVTGHKYVNAYNAKAPDGKERIYLAVSDDGENWKRFGDTTILDETMTIENLTISGDAQIVKLGDVYVMFYFRYVKDVGAYNTFACSYNLTDWTVWDGEPLVKSEHDWENVCAHKSYVVKDNDTVYHYYCAVNDKRERFIALATSKKLK